MHFLQCKLRKGFERHAADIEDLLQRCADLNIILNCKNMVLSLSKFMLVGYIT